MPKINDTNLRSPIDDFDMNRREFYCAPSDQQIQGNRLQVNPPDIQDTTVQTNQVSVLPILPATGINVADIGNAGISNVGNNDSDIRLWAGALFGNRSVAPFRVDQAGNLTATSATISGSITASTGAIGGFVVGADYIRDVANSMGLASTVTAGDDVRFWAGASYASRASAPFFVTEAGNITANNATIVGTISGRSTVTVAAAINSSGNLVNDVVNARLDSASKKILSDFNFGTTNFAGAVNAGNVTWDTSSGAITGGSGVLVYRSGIVGVNSGVTTFSIDATTGAATFAGTLSAPTGNIGGFTIAATTLSATNLILTSGSSNVANIAVGTGANLAGLNSANSGSDVAIWAGSTFANRATAPFYVTAAGALVATSATINGLAFTSNPNFGDGSDGDVTIGAGTTTLTSDKSYNNLTINGTLNIGGYRVFVKNTLTIASTGIISRNGNDGGAGGVGPNGTGAGATGGTAGTGAAALTAGSIYGSLSGAAGIVGADSTPGAISITNGAAGGTNIAGANETAALGANGVTGAAGTAGGAGGSAGGAGGTAGTAGSASNAGGTITVPTSSVRNLANAILMIDSGAAGAAYRGAAKSSGAAGSGSGGSGRGNGSNAGGGGGGAGGSGGTPGNGGIIVLVYTTLTNSGTISVVAGTPGSGGTGGTGGTGNGGTSGSNGNTGLTGTTGASGSYIPLQLN